MKEIKGGLSEMDPPTNDTNDTVNKNTIKTCRCTWLDFSNTINKNTVEGCMCLCRLP